MTNLAFIDTLSQWAQAALGRRTVTAGDAPRPQDDRRVYRLKAWPDLPDALRTAAVYRMLSTMTVKPVTRAWMQLQTGLGNRELDALLGLLSQARALVTVDTSAFKRAAH